MRPVVLTVVEGKNFLLGSFDTANLLDWWKSEPFPGDIDIIQSPIHVYGQYHVCIVKLKDGTYSIYRTSDMGKSWVSVYNTPNIIYTLTRIDYGWVIGSTSTGWIESKLDSGYTWSALSSFAPGCKTVINIDDDVLFAHDGSKVWRSTDLGVTWSVVLNKASWYSVPLHSGWNSHTFSWTGSVEPALAGVNQTILVGFGPYLVISEDCGVTWVTQYSGWEGINVGVGVWYNSDNGTGPTGGTFAPYAGTRILQIVLTDGNGHQPNETAFIIKSTVGSTIYYMYSGPNYAFYSGQGTLVGTGWSWKSTYSMPYKAQAGNIAASNVLRPGSSEYDIFATITTYDANNKPVIKTSTNGGYTWSTLNYSNVTVYAGDPAQEIVSGMGQQVFDEEYWTSYAWVGSACHNTGKYLTDYNKTVRGLSWDIDLLIMKSETLTKTYSMKYATLISKLKTLPSDVLLKLPRMSTLPVDVLVKTTAYKPYIVGGYVKTTFIEAADFDIALAERPISEYDMGMLDKLTIDVEMYPRAYIIGPVTKTHTMGVKLIDDHMEQIMVSIEKYSPQAPDVRYPNIPYKPVDFRVDSVVP